MAFHIQRVSLLGGVVVNRYASTDNFTFGFEGFDATDSDNPRRLLKLSVKHSVVAKVGIDTQVIRRIAEEIVRPYNRVCRWPSWSAASSVCRTAAGRYRSFPWRLHGYARHGDELPRSTGLSGAGGAGHPRADRHHHRTGRRAVLFRSRPSVTLKGSRGDFRRRCRHAVLLHRHGFPSSVPSKSLRRGTYGKNGVDGVCTADPRRTRTPAF